MGLTVILISLALALLAGCERDDAPASPAASARSADDGAPSTQPTARLPRVVFLGDSLTAGYGVDADQAFPALVGEALRRDRIDVEIVNAGVSGDTTAGGLARLDWLLRQKPDVIVVGLGGNDGLRGQDVKSSEQNLRAIVTKSRDAGARVLLLGMMMPPNYGPEYTAQFRAIYPRLAGELDVPLVPFLLEGVGGETRFNQRDGIHPTADGHARVAENVLPALRELLHAADGASTQPSSAPAAAR